MLWRAALVGFAVAAALLPVPAWAVERWYSNVAYPLLQTGLTSLSNAVPFALFDLMLAAVLGTWSALLARDVARRARGGWWSILFRALRRTATAGAALYLLFLITWGLNYRRAPLVERLEFEERAITLEAARALALKAVDELNRLHERAHADVPPSASVVDTRLAHAFAGSQQALGVGRPARAARPKRTLLDPYLRSAGVDAMTDPYFLETLVLSDLLPFERPFVMAHEWSHLAGFADEGEANFVGWLTCIRGSDSARYSGWVFLYSELTAGLSAAERAEVGARLAAGPRSDLRAIAERVRRHVRPAVSAFGWRVYDSYLRANRIDAGIRSYAEVVRLMLGVQFAADGVPLHRRVPTP